MRAINPRQYEADRAAIRECIGRYRNSKAIASALKLADRLLNYEPDYEWSWQFDLQKRTDAMRAAGVKPRDVLQRVAEHYALVERQPHSFKTQRTEHIALARHVLHAIKWGTWRSNTRLLISFGSMLADDLGLFATQLLRRLQQDAAERHALRRSAADFTSQEKTQ